MSGWLISILIISGGLMSSLLISGGLKSYLRPASIMCLVQFTFSYLWDTSIVCLMLDAAIMCLVVVFSLRHSTSRIWYLHPWHACMMKTFGLPDSAGQLLPSNLDMILSTSIGLPSTPLTDPLVPWLSMHRMNAFAEECWSSFSTSRRSLIC